jgi:Concanavalin A-like lectin/glucanases superfamily/Secretion system C-terminal sorting domain/Bacterial Ig-like domain (group 2)/PKD-like domain/Ig-like domain CHU_C associated
MRPLLSVLKFISILLAISASSNLQSQSLLAGFPGGATSSINFPMAASFKVDALISSASVNYSGLGTSTDGRYVFINNNSSSTVDINSAPYQSLVLNLTSGSSIDFDRVVIQGIDYSGNTLKIQLRWSVDNFQSSLGEFTCLGGNYRYTSVNLSSLATVSASQVEFRLYYYNLATSVYHSNTNNNYATTDNTPTSYRAYGYTMTITHIPAVICPSAGVLTGTQSVCTNAITQLSTDGASGGSWSSSSQSIATVNSSGVVSGLSAGTSTITYTIAATAGCVTSTATRTVTVTAAPNAGTLTGTQAICVGGTTTFSSNASLGNALSMDATNDYVTIPQSVSGDFTIEYWVKTSQTSLTGNQWYHGSGIVDAEVGGGVNDFGTALLNGKLAFGIGSPDVTIQSTTSINTGNWTHVAVTWVQSTGAMKLYINGVLEASGTSGTAARNSPPNIRIGSLQTNIHFFNGTIDELRIWNTARTQPEIANNRNSEIQNSTALVAYYKFNQGVAAGSNTTVTSLLDESGNSNNGTLTNFTLTGSGSNWVAGVPVGTWSTANAAIATVSSIGLVTGVSAGTTTITYTVTGTGGCSNATATRTVTVTAPPNAGVIGGNQTFCTGATSQLTAYPSSDAIDLDGSDDYVSLPSGVYFDDNTFTIEGWVYVKGHNSWHRLVDFGNGPGDNTVSFALSQDGTGKPALHLYSSPNVVSTLDATQALPLNEWVHIAAVRDGTNGYIYVNGVLSVSANNLTVSTNNVNRTKCYIGRSLWSADGYTNGKIGEVRIWNIARSQTQIANNMNTDVAQQSGLLALYKFNQGAANGPNSTSTTVNDLTGNGYDGTLTNFALTGSTSNWTLRGAANNTNGAWASSNSSVASVSSAGLVTGLAAGISTITYTVAGTGGCADAIATRAVTVSATPSAGTISGTQTICVAGTSQLTATGTGTSGALDFDGINDQVIGGSSVTTLNITGDITVEGWFKINQLPLDWVRLIGRGTPTSNSTTRPYGLWLATNGTILWQMWGSGEYGQILTDIALQTNRWYHLAANRVGTTIKIYIDGVEVKSGTRTNALNTSTSPLTLGYGDMHTYFNGAMDEIRVWNVGRTQSQINEFMNVEISTQTGLVAYYKFNQGTPGSNNSGVTTLTDASGNSLNATLTNFSLSGNSSNWSSRESAGTWSSTNSSIASVGSNGLVTGVAAGTTTITYTVTNTNGCASSTSTSVSVNATSVAGTATTTTNSICSGSTATVSLSGNTGTIQWQSSANGTTWANITNATAASYTSPALTQTTYYRAVVTSGVCAPATSGTVTITVNPTSVAGTATTTAATICSGSTATVSLSGNTGTIQWQSSANGTTWANITGATASSYISPALTQTTYYRAVVTSGVCSSVNSGTLTITFYPTPTLTSAGVTTGSVSTAGLQIHLDAANTSSYPGTGTAWTDLSGNGRHATLSNSGITFNSANGGNLVFANGTATSNATHTMNLQSGYTLIQALRLSSYAGGTFQYNMPNDYINYYLGGDGQMRWETYAGNAIRSNATLPLNTWVVVSSTFSGVNTTGATGTAKIYINGVLDNSGTLASSATMPATYYVLGEYAGAMNGAVGATLFYNRELTANEIAQNFNFFASRYSLPAAAAQSALSACSGQVFSYTPTSNVSGATFSWTRAAVTGISNAAASGTGAIGETLVNTTSSIVAVNYVYTTTANGCSSSSTISVDVYPTPAPITGTSVLCVGGTSTLSSTTSGGAWTSSNTTVATVSSAGVVTALSAGTTTITYALTVGGSCNNLFRTRVVTVDPTSVAGTAAATAAAVCSGSTATVSLSGNTGTIQWQSSANGTSSWTNIAGATSATYTSGALTQAVFYRAVVTSGVCSSANSAAVAVTVDPTSVAGTATTTTNTICSGSTATVSLSGNTGTIQWQSSANGTTWANITGATAASYTSPALTQTTYYRAVVTSGVCSSVNSGTVTITVNPIATVNAVANQAVCNNSSTTAINFTTTNTGGTTTYAWTNSNTAIGLAASGTGNIAAFTAVNAGAATVSSTITVTPTFSNAGVSCVGTPSTFTITVNPIPTMAALQNQVVCDGSPTTAVGFSSTTAGGTLTYNWINNTPSIGLAATGSGNIASFTAVNTTPNPIAAIITVTPVFTNGGTACSGSARLLALTINPTVIANAIDNQAVCVGGTTLPVTFSTATTEGSVTYNWVNDTPGIGLAASGTGSIAAFTVSNTTNAVITATITVTPTYVNRGVTCIGAPRTFTIAVNPIPSLSTVSNQVLCNGSSSDAVNISSPATGGVLTYSWTNSNAAIGLAASGTGSIAAFTVSNTTTAPISATITVTPTLTNGGTACTGAPGSFTIAVNPAVIMNAVTSQVVCNGSTTAAVNFATTLTGGMTTYSWSSDNDAIGLAASGTGNIAAFTASNTTTAPIVATITVTPTYTAGALSCTGASRTFTITVNPTATVTSVSNQVLCNGATTAAVDFASPTTGGTIVYNWTNSAASIGLAASGTGTIAAFSAVNTGTAPVVATISVRPTFTNGDVSCLGTTSTFTITVNPTAVMNTVANRVFCNGATTAAINFATTNTVGTTTYSWTNDNTAIGLDASGTGNIGAFSAVNTGTAPVVATITVTPTFTNGGVSCEGTPRTFTITINPTAVAGAVSNQLLCSGTATTAVNFTSNITAGSVSYSWTNSAPTVGLAASGTGNIASFTALNTGTAPVVATITVTPSVTTGTTTCAGTSRTFTITVNPTGVVSAVSNQVICNGANSSAVNFATTATAGTTTYSWTNTNTAIGLAASGTGNIASFTGVNTGSAPAVATISVTPTLASGGISCVGSVRSFTITVNPTPAVNAVSNVAVCNGATTSGISFTSSNTGGTVTYSWTNNNTAIGLAASGTGSIASFVASNTSADPIVATITVTPSFTLGAATCVGTPRTFTITVNPTPVVTATDLFNRRLCVSDQPFALVGTPSGGVWSGAGVSGGAQLNPGSLAAGGNYVLTYTFTSAAGCVASDTTSVKVFLCEERYRMLEEGGVNIYPNPTTGRFNLQVTSTRFESMEMAVYSKEGRFITLKRWPKVVFGQVLPIDLSHLPSGLYTIKVRAANIYQPSSFEVGGFKLSIIR